MQAWFPAFQRRHTIAVVVLLTAALAASPFLPSLPLTAQLTLLAAAVVVFGLPHGALDLNLVRGATNGSWMTLAASVGLYLLAAGAVLAVWVWAPVAALLGFLLIAVIHFGLGDTEDLNGPQRAVEVVARGGFAGIAPLVFHPSTTRDLFALLVGPNSTAALDSALATISSPAALVWILCLVAALLWRALQHRSPVTQVTADLAACSLGRGHGRPARHDPSPSAGCRCHTPIIRVTGVPPAWFFGKRARRPFPLGFADLSYSPTTPAARGFRDSGWIAACAELILTTAVFAVFHPLAAFLLYFCFVHSVRHIADLGAARFPANAGHAARWLLRESAPFTVATILLAAIIWLLFARSSAYDETMIRTIFWGLSALTVPHMLLTAWWHGRGDPTPGDLFARHV